MYFLPTYWRRLLLALTNIKIFLYSFITKRRINIDEISISGEDPYWYITYRVRVLLPGIRYQFNSLKLIPEASAFYKIAGAILIAEELCKEKFLPPTAIFIKQNNETRSIILKVKND